jgi:hypothetical protein
MNQDQGKAIARVLSTVLGKLVVANDTRAAQSGEAPPITKFHALRAPSISIYDYVERIFKYAACSSECFVLALIYVDRIIQRQGFVINSLNVHRVVITSIMLAAKFFDDHYFKNGFYAKVGGVPCNEMNSLEVEFLFLINFSLHVPPETYRKYYIELCNHAATLPGIETSTYCCRRRVAICELPFRWGPTNIFSFFLFSFSPLSPYNRGIILPLFCRGETFCT